MQVYCEWIRLTEETVDKALECAGISFLPKNNLKGLLHNRCDKWYFDLDLKVRRGKRTEEMLTLMLSIEEAYAIKGKYLLSISPSEIASRIFETSIIEIGKKPTHDRAIEIFKDIVRFILCAIADKGLYRVIVGSEEAGYWKEWRLGKKNPVFFRPTKPRGLDPDSRVYFDWKILQNPLEEVCNAEGG